MLQNTISTWSWAGFIKFAMTETRSCLFNNLSSTNIPSTQVRPEHHNVKRFSESFCNWVSISSILFLPSSPTSVKLLSRIGWKWIQFDQFFTTIFSNGIPYGCWTKNLLFSDFWPFQWKSSKSRQQYQQPLTFPSSSFPNCFSNVQVCL